MTASATQLGVAAVSRPRLDFPLTLAIAVAAVTVTAVAFATGPAAAPTRWLIAGGGDIAHGELWRLATGPFVHATWGHLVRDLALVMIPGVAYEAAFGRRWRVVIVLGLVAPAAAVLASGVPAYYGLSGLSHAVLAAALAFELRHRRGAIPIYVAALTAAGVVKIAYELFGGTPTFPMDLGPGVYQVPLAHAVGGVLGLVLGWMNASRVAAGDSPTRRCAAGGLIGSASGTR